MPELRLVQVDAFADRPFTGNPAAVVPLDAWLPEETMQAIAQENNLSETAFTVPDASGDADYELRWFTPTTEVALCGHATLASGHVLIGERDEVRFRTRKAGVLVVGRASQTPAAPPAATTSSASHSSCSRVRASAGRATSPSASCATPSRRSRRQSVVRGPDGSRGSR